MSKASPEQRYGPTSGVLTGVLGLAFCAVVVVVVLAGGLSTTSTRVGLAALALAVLTWAYALKPRIIVEEGGRTLLLRNPLVSHRIPLAAVKAVGVRAVTTVKTEEGRYDAVAVGYAIRKLVRRSRAVDQQRAREPRPADRDIQALMTDRILAAADRARAAGLEAGPAERRYAVVELGLLAATASAFVASLFF